MNRKSFLRNLIGSVAAVTVGAKLKPLAPIIAKSAAPTSSLTFGTFCLGDIIINAASEKYVVVAQFISRVNGAEYRARPMSNTINGGNSIIINSDNHTHFERMANVLKNNPYL